jgi:hypothetical protein
VSARPRSATETWRALEDAAWAAELRRIRGLSEDDLYRELAHVGIDPSAARETCQSMVESAARAAGIEPGTVKTDSLRPLTGLWDRPRRTRSGPRLFLAAACVSAAIVMAVAWGFGSCGTSFGSDRAHSSDPTGLRR